MDSEIARAITELEKRVLASMDLKRDLPNILAELKDIVEAKETADAWDRAKEDEVFEDDIKKLEEQLREARNEFADAVRLIADKVPDAKLKTVLRSFSERIKLEEKFMLERYGKKNLEMLATLSLFDS